MPTRTVAFTGVGTQVLVDGQKLGQVSFISMGRRTFMRLIYNPADLVQQRILQASLKQQAVDVEIILPHGRISYRCTAVIPDAKIKVLPSREVRLIVSYQTPASMESRVEEWAS